MFAHADMQGSSAHHVTMKVLQALREKQAYVPYRNSKLTHYLKARD